jgi:pimeloyl-ACP methyl ester carboxylesterase
MPYLSDLYFQAYHAEDIQRKALVLIHGAGGDHLSWPPGLRRMAGYRVYAPDLPGHGKSTGHGLQRVEALGEILKNWIYEIGLANIYLCGHSMGGAIALWLAIEDPDLVHGLALIGTGATLPVNLSLIEDAASTNGYITAVDKICRWSFHPNTNPKLVQSIREQMLKTRPTVLGADFRACDAYDLSGRLDQVQAPTLILVGEDDKRTPLRLSEELTAGIKNAELEVIPDTGHMVVLEKPKWVGERIKSFLDGLSRD